MPPTVAYINHLEKGWDADPLKQSILAVLAYFDIFHYPLTIGEIEQFRQARGDRGLLDSALEQLLQNEMIFRIGDYYSLQNNPLLAWRRREGNEMASQLLRKACRNGRFLQRFPFVRAIGISGSLSKNYAERDSDFDYFIITAPNRLWIARTCMHLFKKLTFLTGRQRFYCMNYYLDEGNLALEDRNIFCAMELKTLLPVAGEKPMRRFFEANAWSGDWLPFCNHRKQEKGDLRPSRLKRIFEWMLDNKLGDQLDDWLFQITRKRWSRKTGQGRTNGKGALMMLDAGKHFARSNPGALQEKVLALYGQKLEALGAGN